MCLVSIPLVRKKYMRYQDTAASSQTCATSFFYLMRLIYASPLPAIYKLPSKNWHKLLGSGNSDAARKGKSILFSVRQNKRYEYTMSSGTIFSHCQQAYIPGETGNESTVNSLAEQNGARWERRTQEVNGNNELYSVLIHARVVCVNAARSQDHEEEDAHGQS